MSLEILAERHGAVPYNHIDRAGNVFVRHSGNDLWCGRIVHNGILFARREGIRVFVPRSDADLQRVDMLIRMGRAACDREAMARLGPQRTLEHLAELLDDLGLVQELEQEGRAICNTVTPGGTKPNS